MKAMKVLRVNLDWLGVPMLKGLALYKISVQEVGIWQGGLKG